MASMVFLKFTTKLLSGMVQNWKEVEVQEVCSIVNLCKRKHYFYTCFVTLVCRVLYSIHPIFRHNFSNGTIGAYQTETKPTQKVEDHIDIVEMTFGRCRPQISICGNTIVVLAQSRNYTFFFA